MAAPGANAKIKVQGRIQLGNGRRLEQRADGSATRPSFFDAGRALGVPTIEYASRSAAPGELRRQRLRYTLEPTGEDLWLKDDGLCTSYGIFGAPGCGKTFLLMRLMQQLMAFNRADPERKYGALILDPKAALVEDVQKMAEAAGRSDDLVVVNTQEMERSGKSLNVLEVAMAPFDLGKVVTLAAQSAGVSTSDPYWGLAQKNIMGAALHLLSLGNDALTMRGLVDAILTVDPDTGERDIVRIARERRAQLDAMEPRARQDAALAINQVQDFFRQESDSVATIVQIITTAYGVFQQSRYACYSPKESKARARLRTSLYDSIIEDGKIVLVSLSTAEPEMAKMLCTLMKCLFQRSVLSRLERVRAGGGVKAPGVLTNFSRPVVVAVDEYSQVASEVPGQPMGDGDFFSLARQNGAMGIIATQSVNVLQNSSLKEAWKGVFSNLGAKVFMRLADNDTTEEATKLGGESDWYVTSQGTSRSKDGLGSSTQTEMRERKNLPSEVLTEVFEQGDAVVVGSLTGSKDRSGVRFFRVPRDPPPLDPGHG